MTERTDFNVETSADIDHASYRSPGVELHNPEAGKIARAVTELEAVCANLSEPDKSALAERIGTIQTMLTSNSVGNYTAILASIAIAREAASRYLSNETTRSQAMVSEAVANLSEMERQRAYARAASYFSDDINEIIVTANQNRRDINDDIPEPMQAQADKANEELMKHSPAAKEEIAKIKENPPEMVAQVETEKEAVKKEIKNYLDDPSIDADKEKLLRHFLKSGAYAQPEGNEFVTAFKRGASAEELKAIAKPALNRTYEAHEKHFDDLQKLPANKPYVDALMSTLPPQERDAHHFAQALEKHAQPSKEQLSQATKEFARLNYDANRLNELPEEQRNIIAASMYQQNNFQISYMSAINHSLDRVKELTQKKDLTAEEKQTLDNFGKISNQDLPLMERAALAVEVVAKGSPYSILKDNQSNLAVAAITITFADTHGGMQQFKEFGLRQQEARARGVVDAEADAYMKQYDAYLGKTLIKDFDVTSKSAAFDITMRLREAGEKIASGELVLASAPDGSLSVSDKTKTLSADSYGRSTMFEQGSYAGDLLGYKELNSTLYQRLPGNDKIDWRDDRSSTIVMIDALRLYNTDAGKKLIDAMTTGAISDADAYKQVEMLATQEVAHMKHFRSEITAQVKQGDPERYAAVAGMGLIDDDGNINAAKLMFAMMDAKKAYGQDWQDYKKYSDEELKQFDAQAPAGEVTRYQARMLHETATQFYATQAIGQVKELGEFIKQAYASVEKGGAYPDGLLEDEILYADLMNASGSVSDAKRMEAMVTLLKRDPSLAGDEALLASTASVMLEHVKKHPDGLGDAIRVDEPATVKAVQAPAEKPAAPAVAAPQPEFVVNVIDARQGTSVNGQTSNVLDAAVLAAIGGLSTQVRFEQFGAGVGATSAQDGKLSNEALLEMVKKAGKSLSEMDTEHDGLDAGNIAAVLTPASAKTLEKTNAR